jgi:hypothetical protein
MLLRLLNGSLVAVIPANLGADRQQKITLVEGSKEVNNGY